MYNINKRMYTYTRHSGPYTRRGSKARWQTRAMAHRSGTLNPTAFEPHVMQSSGCRVYIEA